MRVELVRIGKSRGIRIPKPILEKCGFEKAVEVSVEKDRLVIAPARRDRDGWEEAFVAASSSTQNELLLGTELRTAFDREEWKW
jgi:antitoxin MazE